MTSADLKANRPLSPHIQIYHWHLTMVMSIAHRVTGIALYFGMAVLAWWLLAASTGEAYFLFVDGIVRSWFGQIVLILATFALVHHTLGGIRHFAWDLGRGLDRTSRNTLALMTIVGSVAITVILWAIAWVAL